MPRAVSLAELEFTQLCVASARDAGVTGHALPATR